MGVAEARAGRNWFSARLRLRLATGYGDRGYEIASGHPEFLAPDPLGHAATMDLYQVFNADPVNYFDPRGLIASNFLNGANDNPNSAENEAYSENSLATDASLPPSFYRGLANFANHTLQGLINLPGALFQVGSSSLNFTGTGVTDPAAAWNETQETITQIPQSVLNGVDGIRIASETPEGRDELLIGSAFFASPFAESDIATAMPILESKVETAAVQTGSWIQMEFDFVGADLSGQFSIWNTAHGPIRLFSRNI